MGSNNITTTGKIPILNVYTNVVDLPHGYVLECLHMSLVLVKDIMHMEATG